MKYLTIAVILSFSGVLYADAPVRVVDGEVKFAVAFVNNSLVWSQAEKKALEDRFNLFVGSNAIILNIYPSATQVAVSTTCGPFWTLSEYGRAMRWFSSKAERDKAAERERNQGWRRTK